MNILHLNKTHFSILILLIVCSLTVVCSSLDETMQISGEGFIRVDREIRLVDLKMNSVQNSAFETYNSSYSKDTAAIFITLPQLDSEITYEFKVNNKSDYLYIISAIRNEINNTDITYIIDDYKIGEGIGSNTEITFYITFKYKDEIKVLPQNTKADIKLYYTFVRPYAEIVEYTNQEYTRCTDVQCALDELYTLLK